MIEQMIMVINWNSVLLETLIVWNMLKIIPMQGEQIWYLSNSVFLFEGSSWVVSSPTPLAYVTHGPKMHPDERTSSGREMQEAISA